jgi:dTDP-4-dehydrorhamnose reductase
VWHMNSLFFKGLRRPRCLERWLTPRRSPHTWRTMKTAIIGARGQLGQDLCRVLPGEIVPLNRPDVDLTKPGSLSAALAAHRPDRVINCAAYNLVDRAEDEPAEAMAVNALGVRSLALACRDVGAVLVHFSSDYVFGLDAERRVPYRETDVPGPLSVYGTSKLAGEYFVQAICPRHFVIRTCGLYGTCGQGGKGGNFVEAIHSRAAQGTALRVVNDQECTPTATADLAAAVLALIATDAHGLYHLTSSGSCTWHELACAIVELAGIPAAISSISTAEYGAKARRPRYSVLDCSKAVALGIPPLRPWREALRDYLQARR